MNILGLAVRTRGGVFGPGGYGGGIFDGSGMGFGGLGQYEQAAAGIGGPALGADCAAYSTCSYVKTVYPDRLSSGQMSLIDDYCDQGLLESTPEWQDRQALTRSMCENVYAAALAAESQASPETEAVSVEEWVAQQTDVTGPAYTSPTSTTTYTGPGAPTTYATTTSAATTYPWNVYSNATKTLQMQVNDDLEIFNAALISEDGYLGPQTCGAIDFLKAHGVDVLKPTSCQSASYDPGVGPSTPAAMTTPSESTPTAVTPAATTPTEPTTMPSGPGTARAGMSPTAIGLGIAAVVGLGIFAMSRKKKAA